MQFKQGSYMGQHRAQRSQIWGKLRLNSQGNYGADLVCCFKYKNVIEQSVLGSYYASVERLSTSNGGLWGYDRSPKGDVGKRSFSNEARSAKRKRETESSAACVLGIIFQQTRNKIPWRFVRSCSWINFPGNLAILYLKFEMWWRHFTWILTNSGTSSFVLFCFVFLLYCTILFYYLSVYSTILTTYCLFIIIFIFRLKKWVAHRVAHRPWPRFCLHPLTRHKKWMPLRRARHFASFLMQRRWLCCCLKTAC